MITTKETLNLPDYTARENKRCVLNPLAHNCGIGAEFFVRVGVSPATGEDLWLPACVGAADGYRKGRGPLIRRDVIAYDAIAWANKGEAAEAFALKAKVTVVPGSRLDIENQIHEAIETGKPIPFTTNPNLGRGRVFWCTINEDRTTTIVRVEGWSGMDFYDVTKPEPLKGSEYKTVGEVLGTVEVRGISGRLDFTMAVGAMNRGRG